MKSYGIKGMSCAACSARVEKAVSALSGVDNCTVNLLTNSMTVVGKVSDKEIINAVEKAGYSVVIQHKDNYLSVYRHLSGVLLSKGERVQSAQAIGYAGSDNKEELSMLEFELWRDGKAVNPELYIIF